MSFIRAWLLLAAAMAACFGFAAVILVLGMYVVPMPGAVSIEILLLITGGAAFMAWDAR